MPGLSVHKIMLILERFQPDDYASEALPHGATNSEGREHVEGWALL